MVRYYRSVKGETPPRNEISAFRSYQKSLNVPINSIHGEIERNIPQDVLPAPVQMYDGGGATDFEKKRAQLEPEPLQLAQEVMNYLRIKEREHRGLLTELWLQAVYPGNPATMPSSCDDALFTDPATMPSLLLLPGVP